MADHHQIVDEVRAFAQSSDQTRTPRLESLAREYAEACVAVNLRLGRCQRLLQQGLRSEAIQLAEAEPKLLDSIAALDFPERDAWNEVIALYNLPAAPPIAVESAEFLNEAYALEYPLQELLRTHRRLALVRAPLVDRLAVLRKLAAQDSANPIWTDDQRIFEKARFREVQAEAAAAARRQDVAGLGRLLAEIDHSLWVEPPPPALVQGLRKADAQLRGKQARAALAELEGELGEAFATRDPFRAREAGRRWQALVDREKIPPDDPIRERAAPIFRWLRDEDDRQEEGRAHEAAIQELALALDEPGRIGPGPLERLGNEVLRYERGMPDSIRQRFLERLRRERDAVSRRHRRVVAASALAASLIVGAAGYLVHRQSRLGDADRAATALADMVELGEIENATDFLKKLTDADPALLNFPALVDARTKFQAAQDKEVARQLKFDAAMRETEHADRAVAAPPSLEVAKGLARRESEKQAVGLLTRRRGEEAIAELARRDQDLAPKLAGFNGRLAAIQDLLDRPTFEEPAQAQAAEQAVASREALDALAGEVRKAGPESRSRAESIASRLEEMRARLDRRRDLWRREKAITDASAVEGLDQFATLLADYARKYPDDPRGKSFATVAAEKPIWDAVAAWLALAPSWRDGPGGPSADDARARAEACAGFLARHPQDPGARSVADYRSHLEAIARRDAADKGPRRRLIQLLSTLLVDDAWMVRYKDPKLAEPQRFYLSRPYGDNANVLSYIVGFDGKEKNKFIPKEHVISHGLSPQTTIARKYKLALADKGLASRWDGVMIDLMAEVRNDPEMDAVLKVALLRRIRECAEEGSLPLGRALAHVRQMLTEENVDINVPWMDPGNADADRVRPKAEDLIKALPGFAEVGQKAVEIAAGVEGYLARRPRPVGWLLRDGADWLVRSPGPFPEDAPLWVAAPDGAKGSAWKEIGSARGGRIRGRPKDPAGLAEGRPVFIITGSAGRES